MIRLSNAAGTVKTVEQAQRIAGAPIDELVLGSYTHEERAGNEGDVYASRDDWALNSLGLPNPGEEYLRNQSNVDALLALKKPIVISIAGFEVGEYVDLAAACAGWATAVEINFGCPNVWKGSQQERIGSFDPDYVRWVTMQVRHVLEGASTGVRVKPSPFSDSQMLTRFAIATNQADAVVACNSFPNGWMPHSLSTPYGGVTGACMKPIVLGQVRQYVAHGFNEVIAAGGCWHGRDLADYEAAGAVGVQVASRYLNANEDPGVFGDLLSQAVEAHA